MFLLLTLSQNFGSGYMVHLPLPILACGDAGLDYLPASKPHFLAWLKDKLNSQDMYSSLAQVSSITKLGNCPGRAPLSILQGLKWRTNDSNRMRVSVWVSSIWKLGTQRWGFSIEGRNQKGQGVGLRKVNDKWDDLTPRDRSQWIKGRRCPVACYVADIAPFISETDAHTPRNCM